MLLKVVQLWLSATDEKIKKLTKSLKKLLIALSFSKAFKAKVWVSLTDLLITMTRIHYGLNELFFHREQQTSSAIRSCHARKIKRWTSNRTSRYSKSRWLALQSISRASIRKFMTRPRRSSIFLTTPKSLRQFRFVLRICTTLSSSMLKPRPRC